MRQHTKMEPEAFEVGSDGIAGTRKPLHGKQGARLRSDGGCSLRFSTMKLIPRNESTRMFDRLAIRAHRNDVIVEIGICYRKSYLVSSPMVCVVSHRRAVPPVLHSQCKDPIKISEGGLGDVVDNSGDITCALVTWIPDSRWWWDDTCSARYSSDNSDS